MPSTRRFRCCCRGDNEITGVLRCDVRPPNASRTRRTFNQLRTVASELPRHRRSRHKPVSNGGICFNLLRVTGVPRPATERPQSRLPLGLAADLRSRSRTCSSTLSCVIARHGHAPDLCSCRSSTEPSPLATNIQTTLCPRSWQGCMSASVADALVAENDLVSPARLPINEVHLSRLDTALAMRFWKCSVFVHHYTPLR